MIIALLLELECELRQSSEAMAPPGRAVAAEAAVPGVLAKKGGLTRHGLISGFQLEKDAKAQGASNVCKVRDRKTA
ncbi:MAG: hypothetical protein P4L96_15445 [Rhodoferax sp.]|nr:hypothetical protein [Rhodoferax sp.]